MSSTCTVTSSFIDYTENRSPKNLCHDWLGNKGLEVSIALQESEATYKPTHNEHCGHHRKQPHSSHSTAVLCIDNLECVESTSLFEHLKRVLLSKPVPLI